MLMSGFSFDLSRSFPLFNTSNLAGLIGNGLLKAPGIVNLKLESDQKTIHLSDPQGSEPSAIVRFGYDVVFPMLAVPLGQLRAGYPEWRTDRRYKHLGASRLLGNKAEIDGAESGKRLRPPSMSIRSITSSPWNASG